MSDNYNWTPDEWYRATAYWQWKTSACRYAGDKVDMTIEGLSRSHTRVKTFREMGQLSICTESYCTCYRLVIRPVNSNIWLDFENANELPANLLTALRIEPGTFSADGTAREYMDY